MAKETDPPITEEQLKILLWITIILGVVTIVSSVALSIKLTSDTPSKPTLDITNVEKYMPAAQRLAAPRDSNANANSNASSNASGNPPDSNANGSAAQVSSANSNATTTPANTKTSPAGNPGAGGNLASGGVPTVSGSTPPATPLELKKQEIDNYKSLSEAVRAETKSVYDLLIKDTLLPILNLLIKALLAYLLGKPVASALAQLTLAFAHRISARS